MPSSKIVVAHMGAMGVNVDRNPHELEDDELTQAQNAVSDAASGLSTLRKRPGLVAFSTTPTAGTVLGGIDLPLLNLKSGTKFFVIGRGQIS